MKDFFLIIGFLAFLTLIGFLLLWIYPPLIVVYIVVICWKFVTVINKGFEQERLQEIENNKPTQININITINKKEEQNEK